VEDREELQIVSSDSIWNDARKPWNHQFASSQNATGPAHLRLRGQEAYALQDLLRDGHCVIWTVLRNVFAEGEKMADGAPDQTILIAALCLQKRFPRI